MNGIPFAYEDCWIVGSRIIDRASLNYVEFSLERLLQDGRENGFDSLDSRADGIEITALDFRGDIRVLQLVNRVIAQRQDVPFARIRVCFSDVKQGVLQCESKPADPADQVLCGNIHTIIPHSLWLTYRSKAAERLRVNFGEAA